MTEEWREIEGFKGAYSVSSVGTVRSNRTGLLKSFNRVVTKKRLQLFVHLYRDGHRRALQIHRVVAAAFIGPCPPGKEVNHIDGNTENNAVANLEYLTHRENVLHAVATGLMNNRGERHGLAKLTEEKVREIRRRHSAGEGRRQIAAAMDLPTSSVDNVTSRRRWAHVA